MPYLKYSDYLKKVYKEKVYKLTIGLPLTCPNRDGNVGTGGCTFCGDDGAGHEIENLKTSVQEQLLINKEYIRHRYKANKFIAYFQNYSNTYNDLVSFENYIRSSLLEDIVEIAISTRPDCLTNEHLEILKVISTDSSVSITIELGIQTVNYKSLQKINRGHSLGEFIDAVVRTKSYGFKVCAHLIPNLPYDTMDDVIESAKIISALKIDFVKLHSLYIVEGTKIAQDLKDGKIQLYSLDDYKEKVKAFICHLSKEIAIQRLIGRAPKTNTIFVNWSTSWWKIRDEIENEMLEEKLFQGIYCNYLNGSATRNKFFYY